jgi:hypothetical protein
MDLLIRIVRLVELPEAVAFRSVSVVRAMHDHGSWPKSLHGMAHVLGDGRRTIFLGVNKL